MNMIRTHSTHPDDKDDGPYKWISPGDTKVMVENGEPIMDILCKKTLGASAASLLHIIFMELDHQVYGRFYGNIQTVINNWLPRITAPALATRSSIRKLTLTFRPRSRRPKRGAVEVVQKVQNDELEPTPGNTLRQTFESQLGTMPR